MKTFQLESMEKMQNCYLGFSGSKKFSFIPLVLMNKKTPLLSW